MGANFAQAHPDMTQAIKGGLSGLGQGLQQYGNPNPQFRFPAYQKPALGQGITPNSRRQQAMNQSQQMNPFSANPNWGGDYT